MLRAELTDIRVLNKTNLFALIIKKMQKCCRIEFTAINAMINAFFRYSETKAKNQSLHNPLIAIYNPGKVYIKKR